MDTTERLVLNNILMNEEFTRKVLPFIHPNYFEGISKKLFLEVARFVAKYNKIPNEDALRVQIENSDKIAENELQEISTILPRIFENPEVADETWLMDTVEKWCQDRAIFNAVMESIQVIDGKHKTLTKGNLPDLLQKALAVSFDTNIGHDYLEDFDKRWEYYHREEEKIPFDVDLLNQITRGGLSRKTLNIILAGTGVGKTVTMCHFASAMLSMGYDVLYITAEMSEEKISERIDANLLDIPIDQIENLSRTMFHDKIANLRKKTAGKLIVKEYPTGQANANHFRALLNELKLKKGFKPQIVFIDYLNICASSRMKSMGGAINSYTYIKAIAEELRGLGVEFDVPVVSATQTTRSGYSNTNPGLEDTSESFGLPATADLMIALVSTEELEQQGKIMVSQLKNRYNDLFHHKKFLVGIDREKMRLFDVSQDQQTLTPDSIPVIDRDDENKFADFLVE
jgi:replicative DNA helicase